MMQDIRVSILGRNEIVREGLKRILTDQSFTVETAVADAAALIEMKDRIQVPHLIVVDAQADAESFDMCRLLHERFPTSHVVLMSDDYSIENISKAFNAGVDGYLVKAISCEPLGGALRLVALGEKVMPSQVIDSLIDPSWQSTSGNWESGKIELNLSDREIEILRCLISGDANKIIARRLDITEATVKVHIKAILRKLRVMNRTQAAIWAVKRGLNREDAATQSRVCEFPIRREIPLQIAQSN